MRLEALLSIPIVLALLSGAAHAQTAATPPQRPFDRVTGIVFACGSATGHAWTGEACGKLSAEFRKRAEALKLQFVEVPIAADYKTRKLETVDGFDRDKAVRVFWNFVADAKGGVSAGLSSNIIYEPTKKDHPSVVPGQRIPMNFYAQSALYDPGASYAKAEPFLKMITDSFFMVGEGKS